MKKKKSLVGQTKTKNATRKWVGVDKFDCVYLWEMSKTFIVHEKETMEKVKRW